MFDVHLGLRIEDVGVAGVGGDVRRQVEHQPGIGADLRLRAALVGAVGEARGLQIDGVEADHALKPAGEVQVRGAVDPVQPVGGARGEIGAGIFGLLDLQPPPVAHRRIGRIAVVEVLVFAATGAAAAGPQHQVVPPAEQAHRPGDRRLPQVLAIVGGIPADHGGDAQPGLRVGIAEGVEQLGVLVESLVGVGPPRLPAAAKSVAQFAEGALVVDVPVGPVGRGRGRPRIVDPAPVRIGERQRAPEHPVRQVVLPGIAGRGLQRRGDLPGHHAVVDVPVHLVVVEVGAAVLVRVDQPPGDRAGGVERPRDVGLQPQLVPGPVGGGGGGPELPGRPLAHIVDRGRGIAGPGHHAVGAADDLHPLEQGSVEVAELDAPEQRQADAVDLEAGDVETAGVVVGAVGLDLLHIDPGDLRQQGVHVDQGEVLDLPPGDHGHRLRRLAQAELQASRALGTLQPFALDDDLADLLVDWRLILRPRAGEGDEGQGRGRQQAEATQAGTTRARRCEDGHGTPAGFCE